MTRQELQQLSKAELIEIILRQESPIEQLQQTIAQLQSRLAQLEEQIKGLTQPPKDCSNSLLRPSKSANPNRRAAKRSKKRGGSETASRPDAG